MAEDFHKICRTCLAETSETKSLFLVQYINEEQLRLSEILSACTSLEVTESDSLPKQVCAQCERDILNTFSFQQQCHKSDSVLRAITSESVQTELIELKPLATIEETSIQFSKILSNDALDEETENDQADNFADEVAQFNDSLNEVIDNQLTFNVQEPASYGYITGQEELTKIKSEELKLDLEDETLQPLFPCEARGCCACFTTSQDLKTHSKTHVPKHNYCKICNATFSSASTLSRHVSSKHQPEKKVHLCSECGKGFARSDDLKRHIRVHTGERPFRCEKCGKAFAQSFRLLEHMRSHSDVKNFICAVCGKAFARYTSLLAHNKTHNKIKSHECKKCGKRLCGPGSLAMHMKIHTGQKDYACNFCKKSFASTSNLIVHRRTHTGERPYSCMTCGKSFADNSRLNVHSRIHSGEKPYVCSYCNRGCVSSTQLKRHMRIHTGEKPYHCILCSKSFTRSEDLKNHIKIHRDERNHVCVVCHKGFFRSNTLKVHMRIHTGEKPYSCNMCEKSFSQTGSYSIHMKKHSTEELYPLQPVQCTENVKEAVLQYL